MLWMCVEANFEVDKNDSVFPYHVQHGKYGSLVPLPVISLDPDPSLSPEDFERKWSELSAV